MAANHVPAAAVIREPQWFAGFTGRKGYRRRSEKFTVKGLGLNLRNAVNTFRLEGNRGGWNCWCRGEIR